MKAREPKPGRSAVNPYTGHRYPSWDELVAAETNGHVVVIVSDRPRTMPAVIGPFDTKEEAQAASRRARSRVSREERPYKVHVYIRHAWKDVT